MESGSSGTVDPSIIPGVDSSYIPTISSISAVSNVSTIVADGHVVPVAAAHTVRAARSDISRDVSALRPTNRIVTLDCRGAAANSGATSGNGCFLVSSKDKVVGID